MTVMMTITMMTLMFAQAWQRSAGYIHTPTSPWFQIHSDMISGDYFGNGDDTPLSPLFPFSHGLSYTT